MIFGPIATLAPVVTDAQETLGVCFDPLHLGRIRVASALLCMQRYRMVQSSRKYTGAT